MGCKNFYADWTKKKNDICVNFAIIVPVIVSILVGKHTLETV